MNFGTIGNFVAPLLFGAFLFGCSAEARDELPSKESPVRAAPPVQDPPATPGADNEIDDDPGDLKPFISREGFKEPDPQTTPPPPAQGPYAHLDPNGVIPKKLLNPAIAYFDTNKANIPNQDYITIVDYKAHSGQKRFFIVDMKTGTVRSQVVAHGKMSDPNHTGVATTFSNVSGSNMSSLGFAVTGAIYSGAHGRSLRLEGLSSTNSNMYSRAIVLHRADYVAEGTAKQGRSLGCYVLDPDFTDEIIDMIAGGSLIYTELGT